MGNVISHKKIIIEFDTWEPFKKQCEDDMDNLINKIKTKELLKHCGNVHLSFEDLKEIK